MVGIYLSVVGKSHFKTVIKQTTMPTLPHRHQSFQRQLSNKLDLSNVEFTIQSMKYKEQPEVTKIRPELYRQDAQADNACAGAGAAGDQLPVLTCGKLEFTLKYMHPKESLIVFISKAEGLPAKDFSGTSDPYVKVYLLPDRKRKYQTKVHRKTLAPVFDETFEFQVPYAELPHRALQFSMYDFDRFSRHDLIGVVLVRDIVTSKDLSWEHQYTMDIISVQQVGG